MRDLISLYKDAGWWDPAYDDNPDFLLNIVKNSGVFVGAFIDEKMIGMGRALSDRASDAYIQDVVVIKQYRRKKIGAKIIDLLIDELQQQGVDWIGLVAQPGTTSFYNELGFEVLEGHTPLKYKGRKK